MIFSSDFENRIDAGIYTAYAIPTENFVFEDNSNSFTWQIDKLELEKPTATDTEKIYNGEIQRLVIGGLELLKLSMIRVFVELTLAALKIPTTCFIRRELFLVL